MPAPYNYSGALSPVDPGQALMQGVLTGQKMFEAQQQYQRGEQEYQRGEQEYQRSEQEYQRSEQQRRQLTERQAAFSSELEGIVESRNPRDLTELFIRFPEQAKILKDIGDRLSDDERDLKIKEYISVAGFDNAGMTEKVEEFYQEKINLFESSGQQTEAENARRLLETYQTDPDAWRTMLRMPIAAYDPEKFLEIDRSQQKYLQSRQTPEGKFISMVNTFKGMDLKPGQISKLLTQVEGLPLDLVKVFGELESEPDLTIEKQFDFTQKLRGEWNSRSEKADVLNATYEQMKIAARDDTGQGDIALITNFMKMLDPGSIVRETEFAQAQDADGLLTRLTLIANRLKEGDTLGPNEREKFVNLSRKFNNAVQQETKKHRTILERSAKKYGLDFEEIFTPMVQEEGVFSVEEGDMPKTKYRTNF